MFERFLLLCFLIAILLLILAGFLLFGLFVPLGRILRRTKGQYYVLITDEGPILHEKLSVFQTLTIDGEEYSNSNIETRDGIDTILLFLSSSCAPCLAIMKVINKVHEMMGDPPRIALILEMDADAARSFIAQWRFKGTVIADPSNVLRNSLGIQYVPFGILVDSGGIVRMKGIVNHYDHLEALVKRRGRSMPKNSWETIDAVTVHHSENKDCFRQTMALETSEPPLTWFDISSGTPH